MKLVLLFNLFSCLAWAATDTSVPKGQVLVSSDRYLMKILDHTLSVQDVGYQWRNLKALDCIYDGDAVVIQYFGKNFIKELGNFVQDLPQSNEAVRKYLHQHEEFLKLIRSFFKMLRYAEDQKAKVSPELTRIIREGTRENKCEGEVLYKDTLKTNFITLMQMELYLRTRYGGQLKGAKSFDAVRPSIDLFVESLDKQFSHEYYW